MKQVFILGASSVYGVGAEHGGWADLVKSYVHGALYGAQGLGEACEVFTFAKAGSTIDFLADTIPWIYEKYARSQDVLTLISVGGNDAKAVGTPDAFVSTPEEFERRVASLLELLQKHSEQIVFVSNSFVDESKTNPKQSPFTAGQASYFTNERRTMFNAITRKLCQQHGIGFVATTIDEPTWVKQYLYADGLHPNQAGYQKVFEAVRPAVDSYLSDI